MKLNRILLAVDRGAPSWEAARVTAHLAPRLKAGVGVLTVLALGPQKRSARNQRIRKYVCALELTADTPRRCPRPVFAPELRCAPERFGACPWSDEQVHS
jgi:hypothetical protein